MHIRTKTFWMPKKGNTEKEYEDAAWPLDALDLETGEFRCAVADGATEASFADIWARLLVKGYAHEIGLKELEAQWQQEIENLELPWYAKEKAESGSYAALVGLKLSALDTGSNSGVWESNAVGDSCVLHTRNRSLLESFPLNDAESFNNSPSLLSSRSRENEDQESMIISTTGSFRSGDTFLLLSDAIACWALRRNSSNGDALEMLLKIELQGQLDELVSKARSELTEEGVPTMRNDDVTLLRVDVLAD